MESNPHQSSHVTVLEALKRIKFLRNATERTLQDLAPAMPRLNKFKTFRHEIRALHRGILVVLHAVRVCPHELLQRLEEQGLPFNNPFGWKLPRTAALEQIQGILSVMPNFLNSVNETFEVPEFNSHINEELTFADILRHFEGVFHGLENARNALINQNGGPESPAGEHHDDEEFLGLAVLLATNSEEGQQCGICLEQIVAGDRLRHLPCSHFFHKDCIECWIRNIANCPIDRCPISRDNDREQVRMRRYRWWSRWFRSSSDGGS